MGRPFLAAALVVSMMLLDLSAAAAEPRVALVIGNGAYRDTPLANPTNDARLMAKTLRDLGFEAIVRTDIELKGMKLAILEFGDRLEAAGKDAVGLFYYAGHGIQVRGRNFLVPLNSRIRREKDVAVEAVNAAWVLEQMEFAGNRVNFVILDACRNSPLTRGFRSPTRGLARMNAPRGSLVAYSTAPGNVALEGNGANSPYTLALAKTMYRPGVSAERLFKLVRNMVITETKGQQSPWEESSLTGEDFYFVAAPAQTALTPPATETVTTDDKAELPASEPAPEKDLPVHEWDATWYEMTKTAIGSFYVGPLGDLSDMQRTEWIAGNIVGGAEMCGFYGKPIQIRAFMSKSPYFIKGYNAIREFHRLDRCRNYITPLKEMIEQKDLWWEYLTAAYPEFPEELDAAEVAAWHKVQGSRDTEDFAAFLRVHPDGHFAEVARKFLIMLHSAPMRVRGPGSAAE